MVFQWSEKQPIENLPELLEKYHQHGGKIIEYEKVVSIIVLSVTSPSIDWVPENKNRAIAGWRYSLGTFLLGWWSPTGIANTIYALIINLSGGIDLTPVLTATTPEEMEYQHLLHIRKMRRKRWIAILAFIGIVAIVIALIILLSSL